MLIANAVQEVAVCGAPDSYRGETAKALVVLKPGARATAAEIIAYCRAHLAHSRRHTLSRSAMRCTKRASAMCGTGN